MVLLLLAIACTPTVDGDPRPVRDREGPPTETGTEGDTDTDADTGQGADTPTCDTTGEGYWDSDWAGYECRVLTLVNEERAAGANCGSEGRFGPAGPLTMEPRLREAARFHSQDMGERDYFSHESRGGPNGDDMQERIESAGYRGWTTLGENIGAGYDSPAAAVDAWMASDGHCANIMNPAYRETGVGYAWVQGSTYRAYWTQDFGAR